MSTEAIFSRRVLIGWITVGLLAFLVSLYFMTQGGGKGQGHDTVGPNAFSRSAIGHAGFAEILRDLGIPIVKSEYDSRAKLGTGGVLVIAEPQPAFGSLANLKTLLDAKTALLVLPKRWGRPSRQRPDWLASADLLPKEDAAGILAFAVPHAKLVRMKKTIDWTVNALGVKPEPRSPVQLMTSARLRPIVAAPEGMLVGALESGGRRLWVLSDPDVIANHAIARLANAQFGVALIDALRGKDGRVVFDETIHGFVARPVNPLKFLFVPPYVYATVQGVIAIALLLWATIARFGAPEPLPRPLRAGKRDLIKNAAKLLDYAGHQKIMVRRYVETTIRDVAGRIHAPRGLGDAALREWLHRVAQARNLELDCGAIYRRAEAEAQSRGGDLGALVPIAREIYRWKGEMLDGPAGHSRPR
jgi:Domain of unknown function (DUF4350)